MNRRSLLDLLKPLSWLAVFGVLIFSACSPEQRASDSLNAPSAIPSRTQTQEFESPTTEAADSVLELMRENNHCELPCWWGITPGKTTWEEAEQILAPVATRIRQGESTGNKTNFTVDYEIGEETDETFTVYSITDGIVELIWVKPGGTEVRYSLDQVLSRYGPPAEVYMYYGGSPVGMPLDLILVYPQKGILARYRIETQVVEGNLRSCPMGVGPELWLWSPDQPRTMADIFGTEYSSQFSTYEAMTGNSTEHFSLQFKDSDSKPCIEIPE